jgi:hypothetical protein
VAAAFPDPAFVDDEDLVRLADGGQPVRGGLVKDDDRRGLQ